MAETVFLGAGWPAAGHVHVAVTTRQGGVSAAEFSSLNLGDHVGDDPAAVAQNRIRLRHALALPAEPLWLRQVHGTAVTVAGREHPAESDAAVAFERGCILAILSADCLPVLLTDRDGTVVAAAHAGWRGLAAGVIEAVVRQMHRDPAELMAWLGPAIGPRAFEVGEEVRQALLDADPLATDAFAPNARGRWQADLFLLARRRLDALGIPRIDGGGVCTYDDAVRFYSHRRDGRTGRMASLIWMR
jgi:YfiH family protein